MALINCSMEKRVVVVTANQSNVTSVTLEIIPDPGFVIAARDFVAGANPNPTAIQSITLSDSETTGGPQNDGSYTTNNKVNVVVDFVDAYTPTASTTFDIDPSGSATADYLIPVKLQGTFVVPGSPDKVTFTPSSVIDFASSPSTTDFYAYDNPENVVTVMVMTIAATTNDFIDEDPTISITNVSYDTAEQDYQITRVDTLDSSSRLIQVVYTVKAIIPNVSRIGDIITFTGAGEDIPGADKKIYAYKMNTADAGTVGVNRRLEIYGDGGAQFRIKMERGTLDTSNPPVFTIDPTDGIYVFDNSKATISEIFEPSTSTTTYPSEIDQADGSYNPATNPHTMDSSGLFFRDILIPSDIGDIVYRFTITPEAGTTVDPTAPGYVNVDPDPDIITFDITRKGYAFFEATYSGRSGSTNTIEYFDFLGNSKGIVKPRGRKNSEGSISIDNYDYKLIITDTANPFHLPNQADSFTLTSANYSNSLSGGKIGEPTILAELRANPNGFNSGGINSTESSSHANANANDIFVDIILTYEQRQALTTKSAFNASSFSDSYAIVGDDGYFKIKFFTTENPPVYKSQTILIDSNNSIEDGDVNQQNTTTLTSPAVDRDILYLTGSDLIVTDWGSNDMSITHNLDTFAYTAAQSINTLNLSINIGHAIKEFTNSVLLRAGYDSDLAFSIVEEVSVNGGASYITSNITTSTTHVKYTISGAFLLAADRLPADFNTSNYTLLFQKGNSSTELSSAALSIVAQPVLDLDPASGLNRRLDIGTFEAIVDFGLALNSLSVSNEYFLNTTIVHRLSNNFKSIEDIEKDLGYTAGSPGLEQY